MTRAVAAPVRWLSLQRVAHLTGFSERTLRRWCARGRIAGADQPGGYAGSWAIPASSLPALGVPEVIAADLEVSEMAEMAEANANPGGLEGSTHEQPDR